METSYIPYSQIFHCQNLHTGLNSYMFSLSKINLSAGEVKSKQRSVVSNMITVPAAGGDGGWGAGCDRHGTSDVHPRGNSVCLAHLSVASHSPARDSCAYRIYVHNYAHLHKEHELNTYVGSHKSSFIQNKWTRQLICIKMWYIHSEWSVCTFILQWICLQATKLKVYSTESRKIEEAYV